MNAKIPRYLLEMLSKDKDEPIHYKIVPYAGDKLGIKSVAKASFGLRHESGRWETIDDLALIWRSRDESVIINVFRIEPIT